jgi:hypothetical protein
METLPLELRSLIISLLPDDRSRRRLRLASTQWFNQVAYNDFTFNFTTEEKVPQILCRLQQYTSPIGITFRRPKCTLKKQHFEEIGRLTHLTKLNIEGKMIADITEIEDMAPLTRLTNLEEANDLPSSITTRLANLKNITVSYSKSLDLSKFTQPESVIINSPFAFDTLCIIPHTQRITKLVSDTYSMREVPGGAAFFSFDEISTRYPRLKTLCYKNGNAENEDFTFPYLPSLESIDVAVTHVCNLAALHETLTSLTLYCRTIDCPPLAALTNLRKLSIQLRSKNLTADDMQFLIALTNLEYLKLRPRDPSIGNWVETAQYITSDKMTALLLYGEQRVDYITKFSNLKELGVVEFVPPGHYPGIGSFPYLTKLRFNDGTSKIFTFIESITTLKKLRFNGAFSAPADSAILNVEKLSALEHINFNNGERPNALIDICAIQHLPLKSFSVSWAVDQLAENVSSITTLEKIRLYDASLLTDQSISLLASLTNLTSLTLHSVGSTVTGVTLTLLTSLQELEMRCVDPLKVDHNTLNKKMPRLYYIDI